MAGGLLDSALESGLGRLRCCSLTPSVSRLFAPSRRANQPTNAPRRQLILGKPAWDRDLDSRSCPLSQTQPEFPRYAPRPRSIWRPCTLRNYESWGPRQFSPARDDACSCRCNQKRLGQILGPKPGLASKRTRARVLFLSLSPVSHSQFQPPGNLGIHTVHCEPGDPPAATLFTLFSSASWLSLASPPRAPSRANSTPLFDLVTSSSSPHFPQPELILPATQRSPQHKNSLPPFPAWCCAEEKSLAELKSSRVKSGQE